MTRPQQPSWLVHLAALAPLAWLATLALSGRLPLDLNRYLLLSSGSLGLILVVASLACTPLAILGWRAAIALRRPLGLYGFGYLVGHFLIYAVLDNELNSELIWRDLGERRAMAVGLIALALLLPLALTSTRRWQRRLGQRWKQLHRLIYLAAPLSVLHYLWLERDVISWPIFYALLVGALLVMRLPPIRQLIVRQRQRISRR